MHCRLRIACIHIIYPLVTGAAAMAEVPPVAPVEAVVDTYHGTEIADPYRYMERFEDPAVQAWVRGQADFTEKTLHRLTGRDALLKRIAELDAGAPTRSMGLRAAPTAICFTSSNLPPRTWRRSMFATAARARNGC